MQIRTKVCAGALLFFSLSIGASPTVPQQSSGYLIPAITSDQKSSAQPSVLKNKDILIMLKSGLSTKAVIAKIAGPNCQFDTSTEALDVLTKAGVPDDVVLAMLRATAGPPTDAHADVTFLMNSTESRGDLTEVLDYTGPDNTLVEPIYDYQKEQTLVHVDTTEAGPVYQADGKPAKTLVHSVRSGGGFVCRGYLMQCAPTMVEILFVASTSHWQFPANRRAYFLIDGTPLDGGTLSWDGKVNSAGDLTEFLDIDTSPDVLRKITDAKQVVVQLDSLKFDLLPQNLAGLRALADHLAETTSK